MNSPSPLIRIVDDDASFLPAIARLLRAAGHAVKTFSSPEAFLADDGFDIPGCVLLDLQMPGMSGLEVQQALVTAGHPLPIVFLSGQGDISSAVHAVRHGAEDFLPKLAPKADLLAVVRRALERDARERADRTRLEGLRAAFAKLSPRELEVLREVVRGKLNKQIADDLGIHERTVKLHRTAITTKLKVYSTAELTTLWIEAGMGSWLTPETALRPRHSS